MPKPKGRLTTPLVRDGDELRPASWEEALDTVATGFARARDADASTSFGIFSCSKATNEMNFLAQKFARQVMGTNNIDSCNRT
jgi:formate dehydrogenase (hydrogenase)